MRDGDDMVNIYTCESQKIQMSAQERNYYVRSFGCQMNDADSEVMERLLEREGYRKIGSPEGADVIILNKDN